MKRPTQHSRPASRSHHLHRSDLILATSVSVACALATLPAYAQEAASAPTAPVTIEATGQLEEVVVTARKKKEKLTEVPLSVTAISAKTLEDAGVHSMHDIAAMTPGLVINSSGGEANMQPIIRGLVNLNGGYGDPNVAIFLDGVYLANPGAVSLGMVDMERVEVIKGPVSALYGRSAYGGVINYVSKRPSNEFEGQFDVKIGTDGLRGTKLMLSGPIKKDMLSARIVVGREESAGTWKDNVNGARAGDYVKNDSQFSFLLTPNADLKVSGGYYYGNDKFGNTPSGYVNNNCAYGVVGFSGSTLGMDSVCGEVNAGSTEFETSTPAPGTASNTRKVHAINLRGDYDLGWGDASALFGYNKVDQYRFANFTGKRDGLLWNLTDSTGASAGQAYLTSYFGSGVESTDKSLEMRLASKQDQRARWATGLYLFKQESTSLTSMTTIDTSSLPAGITPTTINGYPSFNYGKIFASPTSTPRYGIANYKDDIVAPFVSGEYDLLSNLTAALEVRHTKQTREQEVERTNTNYTASAYSAPTSATFHFNNYRGSLRYKWTPDTMFYGSVATGSKGGGFNNSYDKVRAPWERTFNPEKNTTLEAGVKSAFLDKRLQLGMSVFHARMEDVQMTGLSDAGTGALVVKNASKAKASGFELDAVAQPTKSVRLNAGLAYTDPKFSNGSYDFSSFNVKDCLLIASCASQVEKVKGLTNGINLNGKQLQRTSKITASLGAQYNGRFNTEWTWFARADYRYESKKYINAANWSYLPERHQVNLNAGINSDKWRFGFFVENLTNDKTPTAADASLNMNDASWTTLLALPNQRQIGLTASMRF